MPEPSIVLTPALTKSPLQSPVIRMKVMEPGYIVHVLAKPGCGDITAFLSKVTVGAHHTIRPVAPGQWFLVGNKTIPHDEMTTLFSMLEPQATGIDQSHGRIRILIEGVMVEQVLAKGTGVDVAIAALPVGCSAATLMGHIGTHLTRVGEQAFEIIVLRGFAESLWDDLLRMSAEYCVAG